MMSLNMLIEFGDAFDFTGDDYFDLLGGVRSGEQDQPAKHSCEHHVDQPQCHRWIMLGRRRR
jgi:hypothetical protein